MLSPASLPCPPGRIPKGPPHGLGPGRAPAVSHQLGLWSIPANTESFPNLPQNKDSAVTVYQGSFQRYLAPPGCFPEEGGKGYFHFTSFP